MKVKDAETLSEAARKLEDSITEARANLKQASVEAISTRKLWRCENKSSLIKVGLTLIALPDPVTTVVGGVLVAAGAAQAGVRSRSIFMEDVYRTFSETLREARTMKESM